jgi:hypothetical protein
MEMFTHYGGAIPYNKTCQNYAHLGVDCCPTCHEDPDNHLDVVKIDGEPALLCCLLRMFFYPAGADSKLSPEERLLRAIFGESHRTSLEDFD